MDGTRLFMQHYGAIRAVIGDWKREKPRQEIDKIARRAILIQCAKYSMASTVIKLANSGNTLMA